MSNTNNISSLFKCIFARIFRQYRRSLFRFFFISILGVLLHFTYKWSGDNPAVGLFSAVNESTWEHLKLIFFPMLLLTFAEISWTYILEKSLPEGFLPARTMGILSGMMFIVTAFYTINGVLGKSYEVINITLYFVGVIWALRTEKKLNHRYIGSKNNIVSDGTDIDQQFCSHKCICMNDYAAMTILAIFAVAFFAFTKYPPELGIFAEPS